MLLIELIKLFSFQMNIDEDEFNIIVNNNNIKLNQHLTLEKKEKKEKKEKTVPLTTIPSNSNEELPHNVKEKRSRGRPRKQCNVITETNNIDKTVNYEIVEEVTYNNKNYYKTTNGVLLDGDYNMEGAIVEGIIVLK
jgi:hypothetical protein